MTSRRINTTRYVDSKNSEIAIATGSTDDDKRRWKREPPSLKLSLFT